MPKDTKHVSYLDALLGELVSTAPALLDREEYAPSFVARSIAMVPDNVTQAALAGTLLALAESEMKATVTRGVLKEAIKRIEALENAVGPVAKLEPKKPPRKKSTPVA